MIITSFLQHVKMSILTTAPLVLFSLLFSAHTYGQDSSFTKVTFKTFDGGGVGEFIRNRYQATGNPFGMSFFTNSTQRMTILGSGNVGIGTINPAYKLDVNGETQLNGVTRIKGNGDNGTLKILPLVDNGESGVSFGTLTHGGPTWNIGQGGFATPGNKLLFSFQTPKMTIQQNGNVGIGTTTPDKGRLQVKGSFHVENDSFQVFHVSSQRALVFVGKKAYTQYQADSADTNNHINQNKYSLWVSEGIVSEDYTLAHVTEWSDYVFDENYPLASLKELEAFIKVNKHLPAIPSEKEVKQNGYSQKKLNNGFLKTIEELTLYAISQEKKIESLDSKVQDMEKQLSELKELILRK